MQNTSINPSTEQIIGVYPHIDESTLEEKIRLADSSYRLWKTSTYEERVNLFERVIEILEEKQKILARQSSDEMGMPYREALGDISKSIGTIRYYQQYGAGFLESESREYAGTRGTIVYEPLGIIYSVAPWNYPYNQVIRSVVPNIFGGNVVLLKHASNVSGVSEILEKVFLEAGFPIGVFTSLIIPSSLSERIISDARIRGVTLTGGENAGRILGGLAGKYMKPSIMELGGSDSLLVAENHRLDEIVEKAVLGRMANAGQKCNSPKRCIVLAEYYDDFCAQAKIRIEQLRVGNPDENETDIGPIATRSMLDEIVSQVDKSRELGAGVLTGGDRLTRIGYYYPPTLVVDVDDTMPVWYEEVFGPVMVVRKAENIEEMIRLANDSRYGLGCSIFTDNPEQEILLTNNIECGNIAINTIVTSYPHLPYGGIKDSGYAKELGKEGMHIFQNKKVIVKK